VALHRAGVTFVLDRAGITGEDGPSHHGMWDLSMLHLVPGIRIAAPRDAQTLREELGEAVEVDGAPTVVRFPKGAVTGDIPALERVGGMDLLRRDGEPDVLVVAVGAMVPTCLEVADRLVAQGIGASVVDPRWVAPVDPELPRLAAAARLVVVAEDGGKVGGVGSRITQALQEARVPTPVLGFAIPQAFIGHGRRAEVLERVGLSAQEISRQVVERVARLEALQVAQQEAQDLPAEAGG